MYKQINILKEVGVKTTLNNSRLRARWCVYAYAISDGAQLPSGKISIFLDNCNTEKIQIFLFRGRYPL